MVAINAATVNVTDQCGLGSLRDTWSHTAKAGLHTVKKNFNSGYRCLNRLGQMGGTENSTKNTTRTRNDTVGLVSV